MDLVSIETEEEWSLIRNKMEAAGAKFIWTSGHKCDRDVGQRSDVKYFLNITKYSYLQMLHRCQSSAKIDQWLVLVWIWSQDSLH